MNTLDFTLLPPLTTDSMVIQLPKEIDERLKNYPATCDRAHGAMCFSVRISNLPPADDGSDIKNREAFMRAALGEYVSMEESIYYDDPSGTHHKIIASRNPLLHIMKQLRNMQFHLLSSNLDSQNQNVSWRSHEFEMKFWYVQDITLVDFDRLRHANRYSVADKDQLISWFNEKQKIWGINELIFQAVKMYAEELTA